MTDDSINARHDSGEHTLIAALEESERNGSELDIASAAGKLADFYNDNDDLDRAEHLYQRAIQIRDQFPGSNDQAFIIDLGNLATLYTKKQNLNYVEILYQRILTMIEGSDELDDHQKISALTNLAVLKRQKGENEEAVSLHRSALELAASIEKEPGSLTLMRLKDLGSAMIAAGRLEDAEPLLKRALQIAGNVVGTVDPVMAQILAPLENLYRATGRQSLADATRDRMETIVKNEFERRTLEQSRMYVVDTAHHPFVARIAAPDWASGWGEDEHGIFVEITVEEVTQALRWCPPGRFLIGSPEDEAERLDWEGPQTSITFKHGFWLFETPVTQALYKAVTGETSSRFEGPDRPVEQVSWDDAKTFLDRINDYIPGLDLCLPSEAQWEYACRAGSTTPFEPTVARTHASVSITPVEVNYDGNYPYGTAAKGDYREETMPVKSRGFGPNAWGLWQMHGNVWEWCEDAWQDSHEGAAPDGSPRPASKQSGVSDRVLRGGSWSSDARYCRSAFRYRYAPGFRGNVLGFRPARGQTSGAQAGSGGAVGVFDPEGAR